MSAVGSGKMEAGGREVKDYPHTQLHSGDVPSTSNIKQGHLQHPHQSPMSTFKKPQTPSSLKHQPPITLTSSSTTTPTSSSAPAPAPAPSKRPFAPYIGVVPFHQLTIFDWPSGRGLTYIRPLPKHEDKITLLQSCPHILQYIQSYSGADWMEACYIDNVPSIRITVNYSVGNAAKEILRLSDEMILQWIHRYDASTPVWAIFVCPAMLSGLMVGKQAEHLKHIENTLGARVWAAPRDYAAQYVSFFISSSSYESTRQAYIMMEGRASGQLDTLAHQKYASSMSVPSPAYPTSSANVAATPTYSTILYSSPTAAPPSPQAAEGQGVGAAASGSPTKEGNSSSGSATNTAENGVNQDINDKASTGVEKEKDGNKQSKGQTSSMSSSSSAPAADAAADPVTQPSTEPSGEASDAAPLHTTTTSHNKNGTNKGGSFSKGGKTLVLQEVNESSTPANHSPLPAKQQQGGEESNKRKEVNNNNHVSEEPRSQQAQEENANDEDGNTKKTNGVLPLTLTTSSNGNDDGVTIVKKGVSKMSNISALEDKLPRRRGKTLDGEEGVAAAAADDTTVEEPVSPGGSSTN